MAAMTNETMTPEEVALYLKVNPQTVYRNLRRGRLPGARVGRQWRIRKSDLEGFLRGASLAEGATPVTPSAASRTLEGAGDHPLPEAELKRTQDRMRLLQEELDRFVRISVERMKPRQILVFGSLAGGKAVSEWSDLDLVVVAETDLPFYERTKSLLREVRPRVGMDVLIYTSEEWRDIQTRPFIRDEVLGKGRVVYEG